jgi:oxalate decarboxylase/phosphoglucose isomerase-like protein (cupin superfamily)
MFRALTVHHEEVRCIYVANGTSRMTVSEPGRNGTHQEERCIYVANGTSKMTVSEPGCKIPIMDLFKMYINVY